MGIQLKWAFALCLAVCNAQTGSADDRPLYKNPMAPVSARVEDLLGRMTLEEKVAQLEAVWQGKIAIFDDKLQFNPAKASKIYPGGIGQLTRPGDRRGDVPPRVEPWRNVAETVALVNAAQHWAVEKTRLGIPILFHEEGLHGYAGVSTTMFPQAIALASAWDPELMRQVDSVVAREIRARGVSLVLSPVVDVVRDPRWGRIEETFGEDPYLVGELQRRTVTFTLNAQSLRYWNAEMKRVVEPGDFVIMTGGNSVDLKNVILTVKSDPTP